MQSGFFYKKTPIYILIFFELIMMIEYELRDNINKDFHISKYSTKGSFAQKALHQHKHYEILHIQGNDRFPSYFRVGNTDYAFTSQSIMLAPPNTKHMTIRHTKNSTRTLLCIRPTFLELIANFTCINANAIFSRYVLNYSESQISEFLNLTAQILREYKYSAKPEDNSHLRVMLAQLLYNLSQYKSFSEPILIQENSIYDIIDYVKHKYFENITLDSLSQQFNINKYDICRRFKNITKYTLNEFLTNVRINKARELLEDTTLPITTISKNVGYNSSSYFTKTFRTHVGFSPTDYRNMHSNKISKHNS